MTKLFGSPLRRAGGAGLMIAMLVLAAGVGTALAATLKGGNNNNTIIGTANAPDTITDGNGNNIIYGLGGSSGSKAMGDTITVGSGSNVVVVDGKCTQGFDTVTPGYGAAAYCEPTQNSTKEGRNTVIAGSGSNLIIGGAGPNTITAGSGGDIVVGGLVGDTITTGSGNNLIFLGSGSVYKGSTVTDGSGSGTIYALNGVKDTITCGSHNNTTVVADHVDVIHGCAHVDYNSNDMKSYTMASDRLMSKLPAAHKAKSASRHKRSRHKSH